MITDDGRLVEAGSGEMGKIATSAFVPLGYYKDEEKSAATFREVDGVRYSFPGDYATVEADGSIILLGRGSACINTGGEKVSARCEKVNDRFGKVNAHSESKRQGRKSKRRVHKSKRRV